MILRQTQPKGMATESRPIPKRSRVTPFMVRSLRDDEIFVFGSNPWGLHNGGASKLAKERYAKLAAEAKE